LSGQERAVRGLPCARVAVFGSKCSHAEFEKVRIVGVSGGLASPSPTKALVQFVLAQAVTSLPHATDLIDVAELAPDLAFTLTRNDAVPELEAVLQKIEGADLLVVGTPISKGSYTGLLKHLFDLLTDSTVEDRVAIIVATDRGDCNSLVLEHSLRPLLSLLGYCTVPTAVFARDDDFVDLHVAEEAVMIRARRAVGEAFRVLGLDPPFTTFVSGGSSLRASR
jgi:FMN reductase